MTGKEIKNINDPKINNNICMLMYNPLENFFSLKKFYSRKNT